jgi:hypothetical protein
MSHKSLFVKGASQQPQLHKHYSQYEQHQFQRTTISLIIPNSLTFNHFQQFPEQYQ